MDTKLAAVTASIRKLREDVDREREERTRADDHTTRLIESATIGGLSLELIGLMWLASATLLGNGVPDELARWLPAARGHYRITTATVQTTGAAASRSACCPSTAPRRASGPAPRRATRPGPSCQPPRRRVSAPSEGFLIPRIPDLHGHADAPLPGRGRKCPQSRDSATGIRLAANLIACPTQGEERTVVPSGAILVVHDDRHDPLKRRAPWDSSAIF